MAKKSWHLDRREFLRGSGVALALPFLDAMCPSTGPVLPKRLVVKVEVLGEFGGLILRAVW